jgi:NADPH-dependent 2,4-dienoyl-CoA reductase/sulfur reductase-like enzyme
MAMSESGERLVVIGGDAGGMTAATLVRRSAPQMRVTVFERGPYVSYAAWGVPYYVGRVVDDAKKLIVRTPEQLRELGIDVRVLHEVTAVDLAAREVTVRRVDTGRDAGEEFREPFDQLLFATGAAAVRPDLSGMDSEGVFGLANLADGLRLDRFLEEEGPRRAVVVGGGYIGIEMAEALLQRGLSVSVVGRAPQVMNTLDPDMGTLVSDALRGAGIALYLGETVTGFESGARSGPSPGQGGGRSPAVGDRSRVRAVLTSERRLEADLVVLGLGVRPNTALAAAAGLPLGERGSIVVDAGMRTPIPGVWAAGDCAQSFHLVSRRPTWVSLATVSNKMGRVAGLNLAGGTASLPGVLGTAVTKVFGLEVARTGLGEAAIQELGLEYVASVIGSSTHAHYYPGSRPITVKLLAERGSGRLLGGQIVGGEGAAKRIDVVATALHAGLTAADMLYLDLAYAPPVSPVWDPVLMAVRGLAARV